MSVSNGISQRLKDILVCLLLSGIIVSLGRSLYAEARFGQGEATRVEILEARTTLSWESPFLGRSFSGTWGARVLPA